MIVLDSSAVIAMLHGEPEGQIFVSIMAATAAIFMSAVQLHEAAIVLHRRRGGTAVLELFDFVETNDIRVVPFDEPAARIAIAAYQRYGKGTGHPAQLNLADCAAYGLAASLNAPLLFKGNDFVHTDVSRAA
jgi:ribonuclease VapC